MIRTSSWWSRSRTASCATGRWRFRQASRSPTCGRWTASARRLVRRQLFEPRVVAEVAEVRVVMGVLLEVRPPRETIAKQFDRLVLAVLGDANGRKIVERHPKDEVG